MATATMEVLSAADYFATPGLSCSGLKDLAISPLRYWYKWIRPDREPEEPTPEMLVGSAVHCAVLEPDDFLNRYACKTSADDYPGCLDTISDLRGWLTQHGHKPKGALKADVIAQVQAADPHVPILDVIERRNFAENQGKVLFKKEDWTRIYGVAQALRDEPRVREILSEGRAEVAMFATDPETGVRLKARMDWVAPKLTADLKSFSQQRGKSIDRCVTDALWYERYHWQAYTYSLIRSLQSGSGGRDRAQKAPEFVFAFVESDEPHEVRLRVLRPHIGGEVNMLWERARQQVHGLIRMYAEYSAHFGEKPWRYAQNIDPVVDEEIPGLAFER